MWVWWVLKGVLCSVSRVPSRGGGEEREGGTREATPEGASGKPEGPPAAVLTQVFGPPRLFVMVSKLAGNPLIL